MPGERRQVLRASVLGSPIAHSLSPVLHRAAYDVLGLPFSYDRVEVAAGSLSSFVDSLDGGWRGLSLTMPLKRDGLDPLPDGLELVSQLPAVKVTLRSTLPPTPTTAPLAPTLPPPTATLTPTVASPEPTAEATPTEAPLPTVTP